MCVSRGTRAEWRRRQAKAARQILLSIAKGPGLLPFVKKLEENLNKVWAVGRQICEAVSVTGQRCKHEVHLLLPTAVGVHDDPWEALHEQHQLQLTK